MRRSIAVTMLVAVCACGTIGTMRVGTSVPVAELYPHRADLRSWIARELAAGNVQRAFYGVELLKTRRYASQRLAATSASEGDAQTANSPHQDLRPVFASVFQPTEAAHEGEALVASRGLVRAAQEHGDRFSAYDAAAEALYWDDLRLYEQRVADGVPYAHALRYSFAAVSTVEAQGTVGPRDAAVSFFVRDEVVHVFVVRAHGVSVVALTAPATELRTLAASFLGQLRSRDPEWVATSAALYDRLIAPVERALGIADLERLYVIPDAFLSNVPFALLSAPTPGGRAPLIERVSVSYLPSATVYRRLTMREILNEPPRILAVGNPHYSVASASLPAAEMEARVVSGLFDESVLLTGADATEGRITAEVQTHNILHFATHGVLLDDRLPGASSLLVAADGERDGFFSAAEIASIDLSGVYLAVLSACETGVSAAGGESLDVGSLVGAFLAAGAPTVVGSLWKVSDDSTTELLVNFYQEFLERGAGDALRQAQLAVRAMPGFEHPYYWGAFVLYGWDK